ncbi:hypothetical protein BB561_002196 [Smittium simulii]|uniref:UspA domain-containing protein n=1 Tax=Smittium simulii TaxID=133385 RepID=A0A2T9YRE3_9FUNG|nr:hypothetical protein BB561_002196 [Smittium simulii]
MSVPLSLRRKVMLIFDQDLLSPGHVEIEGERDNMYQERLNNAYKMAAWAADNIIKAETDHVFLSCCIKNDKFFDPAVVSELINNVLYNEENKVDNHKIIQAIFEKILKIYVSRGISCSIDISIDQINTQADLAASHKAAIVVAQPSDLSAIGKAVSLDWAERMARDGPIPTLIVKGSMVPDSILYKFNV